MREGNRGRAERRKSGREGERSKRRKKRRKEGERSEWRKGGKQEGRRKKGVEAQG